MKMQLLVLASVASLASAIPVSQTYTNRKPVKRGVFDSISNFPFLASSSSGHGSSSSSSSSSSEKYEFDFQDHHHDLQPDFHSELHTSHLIHHPDSYSLKGYHNDFIHNFHDIGHDHIATSYQNQNFGHDDHAISYQNQHHLFDNQISSYNNDHIDHLNKFKIFDASLDNSHLDAPEHLHGYSGDFKNYGSDYKNYGGDLEYFHHAGLLDISDDHSIDHLLDPYSPTHSSYDSY